MRGSLYIRNNEIYILFKSGVIKAELARRFGLSKTRVNQIVSKCEILEKERERRNVARKRLYEYFNKWEKKEE